MNTTAKASDLCLLGGRIIDGTGAEPVEHGFVHVRDGRIQATGNMAEFRPTDAADAVRIDLDGRCVLPGLIDCHAHLVYSGFTTLDALDRCPLEMSTVNAVLNARKVLDAGYTTIRDVGTVGNVAVIVRDCVNRGMIPGPRIVASGQILCPTGGMVDNQKALLSKDAEANASSIHQLEIIEWVLLLVSIGIGSALTFIMVRAIVTPVVAMTNAMGALANGNLQTEIPAQGRTDEIGEMAGAVQIFKDNAINVKRMEGEAEHQRADNEKRVRDERLQLADNFEAAVMGIVESVGDSATTMNGSAEQMRGIAEQTSSRAATVTTASVQARSKTPPVPPSRPSRASPRPLGRFLRSAIRSRPRWSSKALRPRRSAAMFRRPPGVPRKSTTTSAK